MTDQCLSTPLKNWVLNKLQQYNIPLWRPYNKTYRTVRPDAPLYDIVKYDHLVNFMIGAPLSYIYLTTCNGINVCYYIIIDMDMTMAMGVDMGMGMGMEISMYTTMHRFSKSLFTSDTLLEGYILDDVFLVEDIPIYRGGVVCEPLADRIKIINSILDYQYSPDPVLDVYRVTLKDYVEYHYLESFLTNYWMNLTYRDSVAGVIFSPLGACNIHLVLDRMINLDDVGGDDEEVDRKDKAILLPPKKTSACFIVCKTMKPDVYELYLKGDEGRQYHGIASVPDKATSSMLKQVVKTEAGSLMMCNYDSRPHIKSWRPHIVAQQLEPDHIDMIYDL